MNLKAAPGIIILAPYEEAKTSDIITTKESTTRILKGTVIAIGDPLISDFGATVETPAKQHELWAFLSYEGQYDQLMINGIRYFAVKFQDMRVRIQ